MIDGRHLAPHPIPLIKTSKLVEPAEINGSGEPVGGMERVEISYCIKRHSKLNSNVFKNLRLYRLP